LDGLKSIIGKTPDPAVADLAALCVFPFDVRPSSGKPED
jgi:hypothetical protein